MDSQDRGVLPEEMRHTYSVCPVCLKRIPAKREERDGQIYLVKTCPDHGTFSSVIWRNKRKFADWRGERPAVGENENLNCPTGCGLCAEHRRATCCTLLEITARCNMNCTFCFAEPDGAQDPSLDRVKRWIDDLTEPGKTLLQLSGGEPTVRDDLPEIVAYAKQAGCKYVQLNSNGLRLAEDEAFVKRLADAGLSFVFMQFDGVDDAVYEKLRRRPMLEVKKRAIEQCGRYGIGVTLVPVIVPGVNTEQIGDIIRFAIQRSPYVRGVHFQPVSYFGRIPELPADDDRYTLDELLEAVVSQSGGLIKEEQIAPSCCDHPMCGFHGDFIVMPGDKLMPLTNYSGKTEAEPEGEGCCCGPDPAEKNREFVGRRWERRDLEEICCCSGQKEEPACCCEEKTPESEICCCGESQPEKESCCCDANADAYLLEKAEPEAESCCCGGAQPEPGCCCGGTQPEPESCCCGGTQPEPKSCCCEEEPIDITSMEGFLKRAKSHGFTITSMAFQDAGNLDIERLRQCSLHVYKDGKKIPFCAYYLSPMERGR
ncbi:radical SAM (seleno)protein TrsS [Clostridium sp.]